MWRIFGFQNYPSPHPTVTHIKPKLPLQILLIQREHKLCDLMVYLERPQTDQFVNLLYTEFFKYWKYGYKIPAKHKNKPLNQLHGDIHEIRKLVNIYYIYKRDRPNDHIVRMSINYVQHGEIWYLRRLLLNIPTYSLESLRYFNYVEYNTFQESAVARGYVSDVTEALLCFNESREISTPMELRSLFVTMTLQGYNTINIYNDDYNREKMYSDFLDNDINKNPVNALNKLLQYISDRLTAESRCNTDYGLPEPEAETTELQIMRLRYSPEQQKQLYENLLQQTPPTPTEQLPYLQRVFHAIDNDESLKIIVQGEGGSGKSTMAKIIEAYARSKSKIVMGCASTALAASIYDNFYTAHSLFKIPVIKDEEQNMDQQYDLKCELDKNRNRKELLDATSVFIWDEISSQHVRDFSAAYNAMNGFRNKILILMGDKMQIAPVVLNGNREQIVQSSIYCSSYMDKFEKYFFTQNLRLINANDPEQSIYSTTILEIGKGTYFQHSLFNPNQITVLDNSGDTDHQQQQPGTTTITLNNIAYETDI
jgi:hypothetical protein